MSFVLNLLWFVLGGALAALLWYLFGALLCLTVVGIPFGVAAFRIAAFTAFPFGRELVDVRLLGERRVPGTAVANVVWVVLAGLWLALAHVVLGIASFVTIIGIPWGVAHFRLAQVSFAPLGQRAVPHHVARRAREMAADRQLTRRSASAS